MSSSPPDQAPALDPQLLGFAQEMRSNYRAAIPLAGAPDPVADVQNTTLPADHPARQIPIRIYTPMSDSAQAKPVIVYLHGGGFVCGDLDTHDVMIRAMANGTQSIVVSVDYRLAPEHPYPAGLDDAYAALLWVARHAATWGGDAQRIVVSGDSAGANLAASVALAARDRSGPRIAAQWLMFPTLTCKRDTASWDEYGNNFPSREVMAGVQAAYLQNHGDPQDPLVSPLNAKLHGLPPAFLQVGEKDPLRDENIAYADALRRAGGQAECKVYSGQMHGFTQFYKDKTNNPLGEQALNEGMAFVRSVFARDSNHHKR